MKEKLITSSEMKRLTGVKSSRLRYLHETGKVIPEKVTETGYRYYRQSQVIDVLRESKQIILAVYSAASVSEEFSNRYKDKIEKELKEETRELAEIVRWTGTVDNITPIYDLWTGDIENTNMKYLIKQAVKGLVTKLIVRDKNEFIVGDFNEFKKWLQYMNCELIDIEDLKQLGELKDADQGSNRNN